MPPLPPKIDSRTYDEIVEQTAAWAEYFTQQSWRSFGSVKPDLGWALIRIFSRFMLLLRDHLNQVPDKNFLAFLDLIGTQILPPQPARVPLTFYLAEGSSEDALVPAETQVAAPADETEEVIFETSRNLFVMRSQLQSIIVEEPEQERYSDRTLTPTPFSAFQAEQTFDRCLYLACDELLTSPGLKTLTLVIDSPHANQLAVLPILWSFWDGKTWQDLTAESRDSLFLDSNAPEPNTPSVWSVRLSNVPALPPHDIGGQTAGWIRAQLAIRPIDSLIINRVQASVTIDRTDLAPDRCFTNTTAIDLSKDFYPFGEQPRFNDTFYIASRDAFSKTSSIVVKIDLTDNQPVNAGGGIAIRWEAWDGQVWQVVRQERIGNSAANLTTDADNQFTLALPQTALHTLNGESNYWIRARIVAGNYGTAASSRTTRNDANGHPIYELVPASLRPPCLKSIAFSYSHTSAATQPQIRRLDRLTYTDPTVQSTSFQPFPPIVDRRPALYLGFDQPFTQQAIARTVQLYFQVEPPIARTIAQSRRPAQPAKLVWEYQTPQGWARLHVEDETQALSDRGFIRFLAPSQFSARTEFGRSLYWLRCCWQEGEFRMMPQLRQILTNTTWASQMTHLTNESLGSSQGSPNQTFQLVRSPVLLGEQIEVEEPQNSTDLDGESEQWVQWQWVPDFYSSTSSDRHYVLDRLTGIVKFGDGQHGKIPSSGLNNIRAHYHIGGGTQGNLSAATITQLKTTIPFIDRVTNLAASSGGAAQESLDRVKERGAKVLRHRNRAVTAQDIEDLAFEASTTVARVRAITPRFDPLALAWQPLYSFQITGAGDIRVVLGELSTAGGSRARNLQLEVRINGEGQAIPYQQESLRSRGELTHTVTAEQIENNLTHWNITLVNYSGEDIRGSIEITFPGGSRQDNELKAPVRLSDLTNQVEVLIVPYGEADQPTPSLTLVDQVEAYLRDRALPTLDLTVTEPDWVEVTVNATIVPLSLDLADAAQAAALSAVTRFLHPLTGGSAGQGWSFGRQPFPSDLYALLESIPTIDHVDSLTIVSNPALERNSAISPLPDDRRDRFLIYSGQHQISLL